MNVEEQFVSQRDIAELESLRATFREARRLYLSRRAELQKQIELGANVEDGPYRVRLLLKSQFVID